MNIRKFLSPILCVACVVAFSINAFAQNRATLRGSISDEFGATIVIAGSIPGATLGGFILALVEELGAGYVSSGYRDAMGFLLIIVILLFRPTGLFARKERIG